MQEFPVSGFPNVGNSGFGFPNVENSGISLPQSRNFRNRLRQIPEIPAPGLKAAYIRCTNCNVRHKFTSKTRKAYTDVVSLHIGIPRSARVGPRIPSFDRMGSRIPSSDCITFGIPDSYPMVSGIPNPEAKVSGIPNLDLRIPELYQKSGIPVSIPEVGQH